MAKYINPAVMDVALAWMRDNTARMTICNAQPTTYAEAMATYALGTLALGTASWTLANGDSTGRKITISAQTIAVGTSGTVSHIALCGTAGSGTIILVGTCAPTSVTANGTVTVAAWDVDEIGTIS